MFLLPIPSVRITLFTETHANSGCKPCWALIEYAYNLDIPDEVMEHPNILALGEAANVLVTWSNVCHFPRLSFIGLQLTASCPCRTSSRITWNSPKVCEGIAGNGRQRTA